MFVSEAFAQEAGTAASGGGSFFMQLVPILIVIVIFYLVVYLPQKKQAQERATMLKGLRRGDKVVTSGGILGTIHRLPSDEEAVVEIAEGVRVHVLRSYLSTVKLKAVPENDDSNSGENKNADTSPTDTTKSPVE